MNKTDVLLCHFLEVSVHFLHKLQVYYTIAVFPNKAVLDDVKKVIKLNDDVPPCCWW